MYISAILLCNFRFNSLINIVKSATKLVTKPFSVGQQCLSMILSIQEKFQSKSQVQKTTMKKKKKNTMKF